MNKEERIATRQKTIRKNNAAINERVRHLRSSLTKLRDAIAAQLLLFECLKQEHRATFAVELAKVLRMAPNAALRLAKLYGFLSNRNKLDRLFLEGMTIIACPQRKPAQKNPPKSALLTVGNLCGNVRASIERKSLSKEEVSIIKEMLFKLNAEL